jgi:hypothetical protein
VRWWRRAIFIFPILVAIGFSGIAAAFFLGEGTGTGTTSVPSGTPSTIPITVTAQPTLEVSGSLTGLTPWTTNTNTPSATDEVFALWQLDTSTQARIGSLTASVVTGTGANSTYVVNQNTGLPATGCLASWYQVGIPGLNPDGASTFATANDVTLPYMLPQTANDGGSDTYSVGATVWLKDSGTDQSACEGVSPEIKLVVA